MANTILMVLGALAQGMQCCTRVTPYRQLNPKWPPGGPKMADGVYKVFGHSKQLLLNKFFDPSTPSMRKGRDGANGKKMDRFLFAIANLEPPSPQKKVKMKFIVLF